MAHLRCDRLIRALGTARTRRGALTILVAGLAGLAPTVPEAASARNRANADRKKGKGSRPGNGPCGNGSTKANTCRRNAQCCTGLCQGKRCRCLNAGDPCTTDASCCPRTKRLSCQAGTCQPCDVCEAGCAFTSVQAAVNAATTGATIHLCSGVFGETLAIDRNLTLIGVGDGKDGTFIDGRKAGTTVTIGNASVTLERMRITGGANASGSGGGIAKLNGGSLTATDCTVSGNTAKDGAGIFVSDSGMTLNSSRVTGNVATATGGGISNGGSTAIALNESTVSGNRAGTHGGGFSITNGATTLNDSSVTRNEAGIEGGGIFRDGGAFSLFGSTVTGNTPDNCAGTPLGGCSG